MKKKGDYGSFVYPVLILFVIFVSGYILWEFTLSKDAPSNRFADWVAQNFGYKDEYQSLDRIQAAINDIITHCPGDTSVIGKIDDEISKLEARQSGSIQDYMLKKFREMKDRAQSSFKYCEAIDAFNSLADFNGKEAKPFEDSLAPVKQKFSDVGDNQNFQSVILAKEKIALIDKMIKDCKDLNQGQCTPENTKKFCVWTGNTGVLAKPCVPAVCEGAKEELCRTIGAKTGFCYAAYSQYSPALGSNFQSCANCEKSTDCSYYKDGKSCDANPCRIDKGCYWEERDEPGLGHIQNCLSR